MLLLALAVCFFLETPPQRPSTSYTESTHSRFRLNGRSPASAPRLLPPPFFALAIPRRLWDPTPARGVGGAPAPGRCLRPPATRRRLGIALHGEPAGRLLHSDLRGLLSGFSPLELKDGKCFAPKSKTIIWLPRSHTPDVGSPLICGRQRQTHGRIPPAPRTPAVRQSFRCPCKCRRGSPDALHPL